MVKLNLGSGVHPLEGFINIDKSPKAAADLILDLEKDKLPFEDNSVEHILAKDILEHIRTLQHIMNECWRVLSSEGIFDITVPNALSNFNYAVRDPTHVRFFVPETFDYFTEHSHCMKLYDFKPWTLISLEDKDGFLHVKLRKKVK